MQERCENSENAESASSKLKDGLGEGERTTRGAEATAEHVYSGKRGAQEGLRGAEEQKEKSKSTPLENDGGSLTPGAGIYRQCRPAPKEYSLAFTSPDPPRNVGIESYTSAEDKMPAESEIQNKDDQMFDKIFTRFKPRKAKHNSKKGDEFKEAEQDTHRRDTDA